MRNELKNGIILSITVILIILVVYLTTAVFMTGEIGSKKNSEKRLLPQMLHLIMKTKYLQVRFLTKHLKLIKY